MEKKKKRNNRTAGHTYERTIVKEFKDLGFEHCSTSRLESRSRDNMKIDLCNKEEGINGRLPYNIQCKNEVGNTDYRKYLSEMPKGKELNVVLHKSTKKSKAGLFIAVGEYAIMNKQDFYKLIAELQEFRNSIKNNDT